MVKPASPFLRGLLLFLLRTLRAIHASRAYLWGVTCGILAAVCYGANPVGARLLYRDGFGTGMVLLLRFGVATAVLGAWLAIRREPFSLPRKALGWTAALGTLFAASSVTFYASFRLLDMGLASTILFAYPIFTAAIMVLGFGERLRWQTAVACPLALGGILALSLGGGDYRVSPLGIFLVLLSAACYAVYIVTVSRSRLRLPLGPMTFWILFFCFASLIPWTLLADGPATLRCPATALQWASTLFMAIVPTLLSLVFMAVSAKRIGSTPTAILGAFEPLTAVLLGILFFGEHWTLRLAIGMAAILLAVSLIVSPQKE